ncbi:aspartyl-phosphate phosphatase Spo0E family protein [Bacillus shivajii]|uniref:aspartyl-phosphate phosphatase Spo0E family protein n=1 Tax=Bacillus shivajii TaxID=1983719 RepID=UPI001CFA91E7|nr:aspartyl-phosphate phosphatase Spo0E family protein [Bacillus shivajii]UCZ54877.1 aspartyl-phosphate phosphatase Spo0E family protein [Bacillus shivajii]
MELKVEIEKKRDELLTLAKNNGLNCSETIKCSKELDKLIINYKNATLDKKKSCPM